MPMSSFPRSAAITLSVLAFLSAAAPLAAAQAAPESRSATKKDLVFGTTDEVELKLDFYPGPAGVRAPLVVVIHGGGWYLGSKASGEAPAFCKRLAEAGYAAASIGYRLAPKHIWPAQYDDVRLAVQYLRAHSETLGFDPRRVAALGASAGGHLAAFLGAGDEIADPNSADPVRRLSCRVRCAVSFCGPMDLEERTDVSRVGHTTVAQLLTGKTSIRDPAIMKAAEARLREASPAAQVDASDAPMLLVYGERDRLVLPAQAASMARVLKAHGVEHETLGIPDGGHGEFLFALMRDEVAKPPDYWVRTLAFLAKHLAPAATESRPAE